MVAVDSAVRDRLEMTHRGERHGGLPGIRCCPPRFTRSMGRGRARRTGPCRSRGRPRVYEKPPERVGRVLCEHRGGPRPRPPHPDGSGRVGCVGRAFQPDARSGRAGRIGTGRGTEPPPKADPRPESSGCRGGSVGRRRPEPVSRSRSGDAAHSSRIPRSGPL